MAVTSIATANATPAATSTASTQGAASGGFKLFGGKGISFMDVLRVVGGGLMGGPIGAAISFAGLMAEKVMRKGAAGPDAEAQAANAQVAAASAAPGQALADASTPRPGGWIVNAAYGAADPHDWSGPARDTADPGLLAPGQALAASSTAIGDPRITAAQSSSRERPGGWIINAAYASRDTYERLLAERMAAIDTRV